MLVHPSTTSCGRRQSVRLAAAVLLATLALPRPAAGQGTTGTLPDPMSTPQVTQYADRLQLDADQRVAMDAIHDTYKSDFRRLRDNEIADFLERMRAAQGTGMMPEREQLEAVFNEMQRLEGRIRTLDDRFFDELSATLRDDQVPMLKRVRLARERLRYRSHQEMALAGHPIVDLSEAFLATEMSPEVRAEADPVIADYERHLTTALKRASQSAGRIMLDMFEALEELGYGEMTEEDFADPDSMRQIMDDMRQVWSDIGAKQREASAAIADLNRRTYRRVAAFLSPEAARDFRDHYYEAAYPETGRLLVMERGDWFDWALEHEDVSDEQREQLAAALELHRRELDGLVHEVIELIDDRRATSSPFDFDQEAMQEHQRRLQEINTEAENLLTATMASVNEIVPQIRAGAVVEDAQQKALAFAGVDALLKPETGTGAEGSVAGDPNEDDLEHARQTAWQIDHWITGPISDRDVARYVRRLDLDDDSTARLQELLADYTQQFHALDVLDALQAAGRSQWQFDAETGTTRPPQPDALERLDQLRMKAIEQIISLDRSFFGDLEAFVPDEHLHTVARLQAGRLRQMYAVSATGVPRFGHQTVEDGIDLVPLVEGRALEAEQLQAIDAILAAYEQPATDLFRRRFHAQLAFHRAFQEWSAEAHALQGDPAAAMDFARRYREIVGEASQQCDDVGGHLKRLNQRTLEELVAALDETSGMSLRLAYERKAYPSVYTDSASIERNLKAAYKLKDLTEQQREQLDRLAADYNPEYLRLSRAMIAHVGDGAMDLMDFESGDWQEYQKTQEQQQRLRFDRDELCYRALNKLRVILSPEQVNRIGRLPAPRADHVIISP